MRMKLIWFLLLIAIPLRAETAAIDRDFTIEVHPESLPRSVTFKARSLFNHADFLASDVCEGRAAGSPGQAKAREYIVDRLKKIGFDSVESFPFNFIADVKLGTDTRLEAAFPENGKDRNSKYELFTHFRPFPISDSGIVYGGIVFAGYGISAPEKNFDEYAGLDVKNKIVLALRGEPEGPGGKRIGDDPHNPHSTNVYSDLFYKAGIARDKGARALLIVDVKTVDITKEQGTSIDLLRGGGRRHCAIPLVQVMAPVADEWLKYSGKKIGELKAAIDGKMAPASFATEVYASLHADVIRERGTDYTLAAVLPGQDPVLKSEIVVIGAHYDHLGRGNEFSLADKADLGKIHRGADDNASGTSSVLEIAAALHKNRRSLKRTVWIMFFGGEELGLLGANNFLQKPPPEFALANVAAMINLDMVGRCRDGAVTASAAETGIGFADVVARANQKIGLKVNTKTAEGFGGGSDHDAFIGAKIPSLFFFTGSHDDYHRPSDSADKLQVAEQARITAMVFNAAAEIINARQRPKFGSLPVKPAMSTGIGGIRLGTQPDYAYDGKGMKLTGVAGNSPADKAGLQKNDIIIEIDSRKVDNLNDYMNAMKQMSAGKETSVKILRGDKEIMLKIVPERR